MAHLSQYCNKTDGLVTLQNGKNYKYVFCYYYYRCNEINNMYKLINSFYQIEHEIFILKVKSKFPGQKFLYLFSNLKMKN